ncbi:uncharacterized protein TNCV_981211 [Trichonephila clavipes]|uniref:Uncharacterized protein n=1 Tax=Trichonephila clavipes TaxID=2585209 RepID=A0A8X6RYN6_TRICX|nr:uncharacterized protein TNCV_981211 [Trichonephila clavipes]
MWTTLFRVSSKVEYVYPSKETRDTQSFMFGRHSVIGPCYSLMDFEDEGGRGNYAIYSFVGLTKQRIITHILKKNTQITGNHQVARIVRHNDESLREGYIRNSSKEVKLFTSALKAFQCNNRIVMAQRKPLDDFLRGRIIGRLECGRTQLEVSEELGIAQSVISRFWQRLQDDGNVSRCYSTGRPELQRRMRTGIWQLLSK